MLGCEESAPAIANISEERDAKLHAGLHEAEHGVASDATVKAHGAARDFALGDAGTDIVFRSIRVQGDIGVIEYFQQFGFAAVQPQ